MLVFLPRKDTTHQQRTNPPENAYNQAVAPRLTTPIVNHNPLPPMHLSEENKIARIFAKHYGPEDGLKIEQCIKAIILRQDGTYRDRLISVLTKNGWSASDAQTFADALTEMGE